MPCVCVCLVCCVYHSQRQQAIVLRCALLGAALLVAFQQAADCVWVL
jgi:hypothetical protein